MGEGDSVEVSIVLVHTVLPKLSFFVTVRVVAPKLMDASYRLLEVSVACRKYSLCCVVV